MGYKIAVVGATGNVGKEILSILAERKFPAETVFAVASERSSGEFVPFGETELEVQDLAKFDFSDIDIGLFSPGAKVSAEYAPSAAKKGCVVIDNTSFFRTFPDIPLVIPEVNEEAIAGYKNKNIIANPNCSTIQMLLALKPLHEAYRIKRVVVSTYQAVGGAGLAAMDELFNQTRAIYAGEDPLSLKKNFTKQIAFNVIPHIDAFMDDGATKEEWKMTFETQKILDDKIEVHANCARVPVFIGHSEYVNIETEKSIDIEKARELLRNAPGVGVIDMRVPEGYVTPVEAAGEDKIYVSRLRADNTVKNGASFWCVGDNVRKGAALNAVQIAEVLIAKYLKPKNK